MMGYLRWDFSTVIAHLLSFSGESAKATSCLKGHDHEENVTVRDDEQGIIRESSSAMFQMPVNYPRYKRSDYEMMEEGTVDRLLEEYGLGHFVDRGLDEKRQFAMGAFLWE
ncbi:hypothetical protein Droror1_Dr00014692 [Drosera rotundifolia]